MDMSEAASPILRPAERWLGLELRHLAALEAVAREGSFGRAADRLGYTQSAISQQIASLERIVGERLLDRPGGPRRVSLTEAGEVLLGHATAIGARLDAAHADLRALAEGEAGALRVGVYQSVGARILPTLMQRFHADWPGVRLQVVETNSDSEEAIVARIERGELDLAFVILPYPSDLLVGTEVMVDPYVVVAPADHPAAAREEIALADLGTLPLMGSQRCRTAVNVEQALRARGFEPEVGFRSDDNSTLQNLVAAGMGVALMARLAVDERDDRIRVLELSPRIPPRRTALVWHRDRHRSRAARAFVDLAATVCGEIQASMAAPLAGAA
jgi:DNA-binding transcriptional LysR family regulator